MHALAIPNRSVFITAGDEHKLKNDSYSSDLNDCS